MRTTWLKLGDWNAICDVCGLKYKASELKERWDGLRVCADDWEPRHPQELIRPVPDQQPLPWTRPDNDPVYWFSGNTTDGCTTLTGQGVAGYGTAGCARAGINLGLTS
jgi:hypothetical protein